MILSLLENFTEKHNIILESTAFEKYISYERNPRETTTKVFFKYQNGNRMVIFFREEDKELYQQFVRVIEKEMFSYQKDLLIEIIFGLEYTIKLFGYGKFKQIANVLKPYTLKKEYLSDATFLLMYKDVLVHELMLKNSNLIVVGHIHEGSREAFSEEQLQQEIQKIETLHQTIVSYYENTKEDILTFCEENHIDKPNEVLLSKPYHEVFDVKRNAKGEVLKITFLHQYTKLSLEDIQKESKKLYKEWEKIVITNHLKNIISSLCLTYNPSSFFYNDRRFEGTAFYFVFPNEVYLPIKSITLKEEADNKYVCVVEVLTKNDSIKELSGINDPMLKEMMAEMSATKIEKIKTTGKLKSIIKTIEKKVGVMLEELNVEKETTQYYLPAVFQKIGKSRQKRTLLFENTTEEEVNEYFKAYFESRKNGKPFVTIQVGVLRFGEISEYEYEKDFSIQELDWETIQIKKLI